MNNNSKELNDHLVKVENKISDIETIKKTINKTYKINNLKSQLKMRTIDNHYNHNNKMFKDLLVNNRFKSILLNKKLSLLKILNL